MVIKVTFCWRDFPDIFLAIVYQTGFIFGYVSILPKDMVVKKETLSVEAEPIIKSCETKYKERQIYSIIRKYTLYSGHPDQ